MNTLNPELLRTLSFVTETIFPPIENMARERLTELYSEITKRHFYSNLSFVPAGINMIHSDHSTCNILKDRINIQEKSMPHDIRIYQEKAMEIFSYAQKALGIQVFLFQTITLRALWDCGTDSAQFIGTNFLPLKNDILSKLNRPLAGCGIRLHCPRKEDIYDIKIEPWFVDRKNLFVEVFAQFRTPMQEPQGMSVRFDAVYDFLFNEISDFIMATTQSSE